MEILVAKTKGFCFGVRKAINEVKKIKGKVTTLGPLVHNPQLVNKLEADGKKSVNSLSEVKNGPVVIRAHGVPDNTIAEAEKRFKVINLTCPFVKKVHNITKDMESEGHTIIVFGDKDHAEVLGITGNLKKFIVIKNTEQAKALGHIEKACLVSQTTQPFSEFEKIAKELKNHVTELIINDTICYSTKEIQSDAIELSQNVEMMVVVGGKNSGNTQRLFNICSSIIRTIHIETADELKRELFGSVNKVGVTAGASTPDFLIQEVVEKLESF